MLFIISFKSYAQFSVECVVELEEKNDLKAVIKVYNKDEGFIDEALEGEVFLIESDKSIATFIFIANDYSLIEKEINFNDVNNLKVVIPRRLEKLNEIGYSNWTMLDNYGSVIFENKSYIDVRLCRGHAGGN